MSDKELIELAAKAAEIEIEWREWVTGRVADFQTIKYTKRHEFWSNGKVWNPLTDDGDALRLAVKLGMGLDLPTQTSVYVVVNNDQLEYCKNKDHYAATRRAIVRAAAEIGRTL